MNNEAGKGDSPRPYSVPGEVFRTNHDRIFRPKNIKRNTTDEEQFLGGEGWGMNVGDLRTVEQVERKLTHLFSMVYKIFSR